ncbi:hypothetical protein AJ87_05190 [Rhizobium yanglingense]|nr:hypothetical protein AJ87_05190 [Rhizobium yanglingense]
MSKSGDSAGAQIAAAQLNAKLTVLTPKMTANNDALMSMLNDGGDAVSASVNDRIHLCLAIIAAAVIGAIALGIVIAQAGITSPMANFVSE